MNKFPFPYLLGFLAVAAWGFPPFSRPALAETCDPPIAVAVSVQGDVKVKHGKAGEWLPVHRKDAFCPGDILRVMERSRADLLLMNETTLRLDQTTEIAFIAPATKKETWLDVLLGGAYFLSRTPRRFVVGTPFINAGIEGTEFFVRAESDKTLVTVFEGKVTAANDRGSVTLDRGQSAEASVGQAPVLRAVAHPRDAVQWTLYYPAVVAPWEGAPQDWRERAAALLTVGRADEAQVVIDEALKNAPGDADALALQAVIAVARNEKGTAFDLAKKAVAANPESAAARVALSYAQQANFDLEGALASLQAAVRVEPENAFARARLSELLLSFGRLDEALDEAQKASAKNPGIARTQTVLGFAYLAQVKTRDSRESLRAGDRAGPGGPPPAPGAGAGDDPGRRRAGGSGGDRDRGKPRPEQLPDPQLPGEGVLRGETREDGIDAVHHGEGAGPRRSDALFLRRDPEAVPEPAGGGAAGPAEVDLAERQPGGLPIPPSPGRGPGGPQREPREDLRRPRFPAAGPGGRVEVGQHRPGELLRAPVPGGLLRGSPAA